MRTPSYIIPYKYGDTIYLKPFFDIHKGHSACDFKQFKQDLEDTCEQTYYIFGGDTLDSIVVKDPRYRKSSDAALSEAIIDENIEEMVEILQPYKSRIIGFMRGNHEDQVLKHASTDITARLSRRLETEDLGFSGLLRLKFREKIKNKRSFRSRTVIVYYHHGWGGGSRTQGADLTKFSHIVKHWEADLFLFGHVHKKQSDYIARLGLCGEKIISKPIPIVICGTYLKTYLKSKYPTYSEVSGYPPTVMGSPVISIKPWREWVKIKAHTE